MVRTRRQIGGEAAIVGIAFFTLAAFSLVFTRFDGGAAFLWLATAPLLAYLSQRTPNEWPLAVIAAGLASLLSSIFFGLGPVTGVPIAIAIAGEGLTSAAILRRLKRDFTAFDNLTSVGLFVLVAGGIAPSLSGLIGAAAIALKTGQGFWFNWRAWYFAHGLGTVAFAPLLLLAMRGDLNAWLGKTPSRSRVEALALLLAVALTSVGVFGQEKMPLLFLPMLPILIATFRLGRLGASASMVLLTLIGGILTIRGHGPVSLMQTSIGERAQFFQFYIAVSVMMVLPFAAELKRREWLFRRLGASEAGHRVLTESLGDTVIHASPTGEVRFVSSAVMELAGYTPAEIVGRNVSDFILPDDLSVFETARQSVLSDPDHTATVEYRTPSRKNDFAWCETRMRSYVDERGITSGIVLVVRDVTRRKVMEAELAQEARTDELTGLPNRRAFFNRLDYVRGEVAAGLCVGCVALVDIDFFKRVNDRHGHSTGDAVLKAVTSAARGALRNTDMIARVGGEEFGIVLWGTDLAQATRTCERVRAAIADCVTRAPGGDAISVTASLGIAVLAPACPGAAAYELADQALYQAKAEGRNRLTIAA